MTFAAVLACFHVSMDRAGRSEHCIAPLHSKSCEYSVGSTEEQAVALQLLASGDDGKASAQLLDLLAAAISRTVDSNAASMPCPVAGMLAGARPSAFHSTRVPPISIQDYVVRIAKHTSVSAVAFVAALHYMQTVCQADRALLGPHQLTVHRLLLAAVLLAAKLYDDNVYDNVHFARVGGVPLTELMKLEIEMLARMEHRLLVPREQLSVLVEQLQAGSLNLGGA